MRLSDIRTLPEFFDRYIGLVGEEHLMDALHTGGPGWAEAHLEKIVRLGQRVYAPGKWTAADIFQHLLDTERILAYRALRFARNDKTVLPGFDENQYAAEAKSGVRTPRELLAEWHPLRQSTIGLFSSFDAEALQRTGATFAGSISVLALGFTIAGHALHHMKVLEERYFPLLTEA